MPRPHHGRIGTDTTVVQGFDHLTDTLRALRRDAGPDKRPVRTTG